MLKDSTTRMEFIDYQLMLSVINSLWSGFLLPRAKTKQQQMISTT